MEPISLPPMSEEVGLLLGRLCDEAAQRMPGVTAALHALFVGLHDRMAEVMQLQGELPAEEEGWRETCARLAPRLELNLRGRLFEVERDVLLSQDCLFFLIRLATESPNHNGAYFIDLNPLGLEMVLEYLRSGELILENLDAYSTLCVEETMAFFGLKPKNTMIYHHHPSEFPAPDDGASQDSVPSVRWKVNGYLDFMQSAYETTDLALRALRERKQSMEAYKQLFMSERVMAKSMVRLSLRGQVFETFEATLLRGSGSYFHSLLCSGMWPPGEDGVYYIDRPHEGFDRILDYCRSGNLSFIGLSDWERECMEANIDYFQVRGVNSMLGGPVYFTIFKGHTGSITALVQLSDGRVCSGAKDKTLRVWSLAGESCDLVVPLPDAAAYLVALSQGRVCSSSLESPLILVWDVQSGNCTRALDNGDGIVTRLATQWTFRCPATRRIGPMIELDDGMLCCAWNGCVRVWDVDRGRRVRTVRTPWAQSKRDTGVCSLLQLSDGRVAAASMYDGNIYIVDLQKGVCEVSLDTGTRYSAWPKTLIEDPRGQLVCIRNTTVQFWDLGTHSLIIERETSIPNYEVSLMRDGKACSAVYIGGSFLVLWDLETCHCEKKFEYEKTITALMSLADGAVCFASSDFSIRVWK